MSRVPQEKGLSPILERRELQTPSPFDLDIGSSFASTQNDIGQRILNDYDNVFPFGVDLLDVAELEKENTPPVVQVNRRS